METKRIEFTKGDSTWSLQLSEATALIGMKRSVARASNRLSQSGELASSVLRGITYPDLTSCVVEASGFDEWPISYDDFAQLPEQLVMLWEAAAYDLNPHWLPEIEGEEAETDLKKTAIGVTSE